MDKVYRVSNFFFANCIKKCLNYGKNNFQSFLLYLMRSVGESIGIGLAASSTSKGPQVKTTEPINSIKVKNCSIQLG